MEETNLENSAVKNFSSYENSKLEVEDIISKYTGKQYFYSCRDYDTNPNIEEELTEENAAEIKFSANKISNSMDTYEAEAYSLQTSQLLETIKQYSDKNLSKASTKFFHKGRISNNSISYMTDCYHSNQPLHSSLLNHFHQHSASKGKQLQQSVTEKKGYKNQICIVSNRIKMLKDQENDINKKMKNMMTCAIKDEKIKTEKNKFKSVLYQAKIEKISTLEKNKQFIQNEKKKRGEKLEQSREDILKKKKDDFECAKNDKFILETMTTQFNSHVLNKNNYKYIKNKHQLIEGRTDRFKKKAEREELAIIKLDDKMLKEKKEKEDLRKRLKELADIEEICLESLKKTLMMKDRQIARIESFKCKNNLNSVDFDEEKNILKEINSSFKLEKKIRVKTKSVMTPEKIMKTIKQWR